MCSSRQEIIAAACHSAWYAYTVLALQEEGEPWPSAPQWQRESIMDAIEFWDDKMAEFDNQPAHGTSEQWFQDQIGMLAPLSHVNWMKHKEADGWIYGETKDPVAKTHHCMVPYSDLPADQQRKDAVVIQAYLSLRLLVPGSPASEGYEKVEIPQS
jgi:hypothetical protein